MRYLGGKSRLAKRLVSKMLELAPETQAFIEPFMGGGAMTLELAKHRPVLSCDAFPGLVDFYRAVRAGLRAPVGGLSDEQYNACKTLAASGRRDPELILVGFALSFGGMWYHTNARVDGNPKNKHDQFFNNWAAKFVASQDIYLHDTSDYSFVSGIARKGLTIYCDPPYSDTFGYKGTASWDPARFFQTAQQWARSGSRVFISEYKAPFREVLCLSRRVSCNNKNNSAVVCDRLFEVDP